MSVKMINRLCSGTNVALFVQTAQTVTLLILPAAKEALINWEKPEWTDPDCIEPLVHVALCGDTTEAEYSAGISTRYTETTRHLRLVDHACDGSSVNICMEDESGHRVNYHLTALPESNCFESWAEFENNSGADALLEGITSFSLGVLSPLQGACQVEEMLLHRFRSFWAAEGRLVTQRAGDLGLEPAWAWHGRRMEMTSSNGSMPVRGWFSTAALEDPVNHVLWGVQLYTPGAWQIETACLSESLSFAGGQGDFNNAHWRKLLRPGESFASPKAVLSCTEGDLDRLCQNLTDAQRPAWRMAPPSEADLPIMFNEYCTTWGNPSHENLEAIAARLEGLGIRYLTIDSGWYADREHGWAQCSGDWIVNRELFPQGIKAAADMIRSHGMIPGLWFEMENVGRYSQAFQREEMLLKRDGHPITSGSRRFLDMESPAAIEHLRTRMVELLKNAGFGYLKIDYNELFAPGCDGYESMGEGLRRKLTATQNFLKALRREMPELVIENCASGGHRLEPSMMAIAAQASFSDAHESKDIPVIAANLHRLILPAQSQIWAVLRKEDDVHRLYYSLLATLLGRMCLSGDVHQLNESQWQIVRQCMDFYREAAPVIDRGHTRLLTASPVSYRHLKGVQAVWREDENQALLVIHRFDSAGEKLTLPPGWRAIGHCGAKISSISADCLSIEPGSFSADAYLFQSIYA